MARSPSTPESRGHLRRRTRMKGTWEVVETVRKYFVFA